MSNIFFALTLFCYFIGATKHIVYLGIRRKQLFYIATISIVIGFILHTIALIMLSSETGHGPYSNFYEYTNFFSWAIIMIYLVAEYKYKIKDLGAFIMPIAVLLTAVATTFPQTLSSKMPVLKFWLILHITMSFMGYAAFALTFAVGIMYIIQENYLKKKRLGKIYYRLPSLEVLDELNHRVIDIGFLLFTLGIITGAIWSVHAKGSIFLWSPSKTIPLILTYLIYITLFIGRLTVGWRGKKAASFAIVGFFAVLITYLLHIQ